MKRIVLEKNILIPEGTILSEAPRIIQLSDSHYILTIGIGKDHTATLIIDEEAVRELKKLKKEVTIF